MINKNSIRFNNAGHFFEIWGFAIRILVFVLLVLQFDVLQTFNARAGEVFWENDKFKYAQKITPPVTAKKIPTCPEKGVWNNCFGTYTDNRGTKYVGEWKDDKSHGQGTETYANGNQYVGEWKNGKRHGQGTYTFANGRVKVGIKIPMPDTATVDQFKQKFGADRDAFYRYLPRGVWRDGETLLVVAYVKDEKGSPRQLELLMLSDLDDLILGHIGNIPKYDLRQIPFKSPTLRELSGKLAYQKAFSAARNYKTSGRIPYRETAGGQGKMVFETKLEFLKNIEGKVNNPDWDEVRREVLGSLFRNENFRSLQEILRTEARIIDILIVKELLDKDLRVENSFDISNIKDPIEYAKKVLSSYEGGLAFSGPPKTIIRPMLKGHRFFQNLFNVVSRLPVATPASAKAVLNIIRKPLENIKGGDEFYKIITRSYFEPLPQTMLGQIEESGAYAAKYTARTSGMVFFEEKSNNNSRDHLKKIPISGASDDRLLSLIAANPAAAGPYLQFAKSLRKSGKVIPAAAFFHFALREAPWDLSIRRELTRVYSEIGAHQLAKGMAQSIVFDDIRGFFPKIRRNPEWDDIIKKALRLINNMSAE
ncbi:MAG: hypothetical protein CL877_08010 [Dehalococcoidales bacterium]|nr:hypothetical protein [Dehalococcoidales bacterium]